MDRLLLWRAICFILAFLHGSSWTAQDASNLVEAATCAGGTHLDGIAANFATEAVVACSGASAHPAHVYGRMNDKKKSLNNERKSDERFKWMELSQSLLGGWNRQ